MKRPYIRKQYQRIERKGNLSFLFGKDAIMKIIISLCSVLLLFVVNASSDTIPLPDGYKIIETSGNYTKVLTPSTTYPVILKEYKPEVIIESKWGHNGAEFGAFSYMRGSEINNIVPQSFVVDSKEQIYVLDLVNNRIQKFNQNGLYLISIPVPAFQDKNGVPIVKHKRTNETAIDNLFYEGLEILIDSRDNLYYHFRKKKKEEIWKITNDKVVKKMSIPAEQWVRIDENDMLWAGDFNVFDGQTKHDENILEKNIYKTGNHSFVVEKKDSSSVEINVYDSSGTQKGVISLMPSGNQGNNRIFFDLLPGNVVISRADSVFMRYSEKAGYNRIVYINEYSLTGNLLSIALNGQVGQIYPNGNGYEISSLKSFKLIKWNRIPA